VAGDVNRVRDELRQAAGMARLAKAEAPASNLQQESLFEYHLYTLGRPTNDRRQPDEAGGAPQRGRRAGREGLVLQGSDYYYDRASGNIGQKDEGRGIRAVRKPRVVALSACRCERRGARLQEGQLG